jgi:hypothetical protein
MSLFFATSSVAAAMLRTGGAGSGTIEAMLRQLGPADQRGAA